LEPNPELALQEALAKLERCFGTARKQCQAQITKLLNRPVVPATEAGLLEFDSDLEMVYKIVRRCGRTLSLNSEHVLKALLDKLPEGIADIWEDEVSASEEGIPTYELLMKVIRKQQQLKQGILNQWREEALIEGKNETEGDKNNVVEEDTGLSPIKMNVIEAHVGQVEDSEPEPPDEDECQPGSHSSTCLCQSPAKHDCLGSCPRYKQARTVDERWSLLVGRGACFRCLKYGHAAAYCPEGYCSVGNCYERHHPSLHPVYKGYY